MRSGTRSKRYLLDTHVVLWALTNPRKLSAQALYIIDNDDVFVSALTVWEVAQKEARGKTLLPGASLIPAVRDAGAEWLALLPEHVEAGMALAGLHGDPIDRMLVGTARVEHMILLTRDTQILQGAATALGALLLEA